jgi:hypothetical protein
MAFLPLRRRRAAGIVDLYASAFVANQNAESGGPAQARHWVLSAPGSRRRGEIVGADADVVSILQPPALRNLRAVERGRRQPPKP